jgi:ornithine cyclodeaminase/alanine dehydrogenase-like protein (mu-crystallin family)
MLDSILYLTSAEVRAACADLDPVAVTRDALACHATGATVLPNETYLSWFPDNGSPPSGDLNPAASATTARSLGMSGMVMGSSPVVGTKIINSNPANPTTGIPRASGLTVLFDPETARPVCIMEAAHISALRTASATVLAAELLQARPITTAALIGAGAQANAHLGLFLSHLSGLERVRIFDQDLERANTLREKHETHAEDGGTSLEIVASAREAIADAELIATVTTTTTGYIPFDWLSEGATLVSISLDDPLPDVVATADIVVVDDWKLIAEDSRRLLGRLYRQGLVCGPEQGPNGEGRRVDATIGDLILGRHPGRRDPDEIAYVNPFGLAIEDLALAQLVYEHANSAGHGRQLPFEG